jgi:hypothetical protein
MPPLDLPMPMPLPLETDLYAPVKRLLEGQGYEVKGEVGKVDIVAQRGGEPPVLVELKTSFSLSLFHQAVDRLALSEVVYIAVPHKPGKVFAKAVKRNVALCRRLGIGLMTVRLGTGAVVVHLDAGAPLAKRSKVKQARLLREFSRRVGDPNAGGATRQGLVTAYRQDALRCLMFLSANGPTKAAAVAVGAQVETARRIMADDHYGWFTRIKVGVYAATPAGEAAMGAYEGEVARLEV